MFTRNPKIVKFFLLSLLVLEIGAVFKLTKIECRSKDVHFGDFEYCGLRTVSRDITEMSLKYNIMQEAVRESSLHIELLRKYSGYRPFLFNYTVDACLFFKERKSPIMNAFYTTFKEYTNLNHTCPYEAGTHIAVDKMVLLSKNLLVPLPSGEYIFNMDWILNRQLRAVVNAWFTLKANP